MAARDLSRSQARPRGGALLRAAFALAAGLAIAACEAAPIGDLELTRSALEQAREAGAETWAKEEYAHARALFDDATMEMTAQAVRWSAFRSYGKARQALAAARTDALGARDAAVEAKDLARRDASEALQRTRSALDGARASLRIAPSPRDGRAQAARLRSDLEAVEVQLPAVERLIEAGDYGAAAVKAEELAARVQKALSRFFEAIEDQANGGRPVSSRRIAGRIGGCREGSPALSWLRTAARKEAFA